MKIALVYDRVNKIGGAERVLLALHEMFPEAPLFTSVYDKKKALWASVFEVRTSFLQNFPHIRSNHEFYPFLMPIAFEQFNFDDFDVVISVTSEAAKGIITKPGTTHICYCLTPTRYLWSGYELYFKNPWMRFLTYPFVKYLRRWDLIASARPDKFVAISEEVKRRIKEYYHRESEVIYPAFYFESGKETAKMKREDYFLVVSRLVDYKRIDVAIKACNLLGRRLKIVGSGKELGNLKRIAGDSIEFCGNVSDVELENYYRGALALLHPGIEDFGLSVVEAQRFGTPVIAYRGGGAIETVKEGKTGMFFDSQSAGSLGAAIKKFDTLRFKEEDCIRQANSFSMEIFKRKFFSLVQDAI